MKNKRILNELINTTVAWAVVVALVVECLPTDAKAPGLILFCLLIYTALTWYFPWTFISKILSLSNLPCVSLLTQPSWVLISAQPLSSRTAKKIEQARVEMKN